MTSSTPLLAEQMQDERKARARMALLRGEMTVLPKNDCTWMVASKGSRYTVSLDESAWVCTCPDFAGRCQRYSLRCKHIEAVRIIEARQEDYPHMQSPFAVSYTEEHMTRASSTLTPVQEASERELSSAPPGHDPPPVEELIWRLRQPLDMSRVKRRQAPGQGTVPYLEGYDIIETANDLFLFRWSFDLLSEPRIMRWDKVVTFYDQRAKKKVPVLSEDGKPTTEVAGVVYITGRITVELGGKDHIHADVGRCIFNGDTPEALDMAIAGAATDCLKRCFRHLGEQFGNSLYDKEIARVAGLENGSSTRSSSTRNGLQDHKANQQRTANSPPEALQYQDGTEVDMNNVAEVGAFIDFKTAHQSLAPASRDVLRSWTAGHNSKK